MRAVVIGLFVLASAVIAWGIITDVRRVDEVPEETAESAEPAAPVIEDINQLEEQLYRAVGLQLDNDRMYLWSEIASVISICALTPCRDGNADPASTAILRIALVRNGWYEMNASAANPTWTHDGLVP